MTRSAAGSRTDDPDGHALREHVHREVLEADDRLRRSRRSGTAAAGLLFVAGAVALAAAVPEDPPPPTS